MSCAVIVIGDSHGPRGETMGEEAPNVMHYLEAVVRHQGKTWNEVAIALGMSPSTPGKWKRGQGQPTWEGVLAIAKYLDVSDMNALAAQSNVPYPAPRTAESLLLNDLIGSGPGQLTVAEAMQALLDAVARKNRGIGRREVAEAIGPVGPTILKVIEASEPSLTAALPGPPATPEGPPLAVKVPVPVPVPVPAPAPPAATGATKGGGKPKGKPKR